MNGLRDGSRITTARSLRTLWAAVEAGSKEQGSKVSAWKFGAYHELTIPNPVLGRLPLVGTYFNIGPVWMSG